jgi:DNA-3-methyladenine glycosylase
MILPRSYYLNPDVVDIARDLLGKYLFTRIGREEVSAIIVETEAYAGTTDRASHAFGGRCTDRTRIMYLQGGTAYVYLCYGIHSLFNVVTNSEGSPHAVLIRGIVPVDGAETMKNRIHPAKIKGNPGIGPGKVSKLMGIHFAHSGLDLTKGPGGHDPVYIWLEDRNVKISPGEITASPRVGVDYAGADALLPYRFRVDPARVGLV